MKRALAVTAMLAMGCASASAGAGGGASEAAGAVTPPSQRDPGCIKREFRPPGPFAPVTVRFTIEADGSVSELESLHPEVDPAVMAAIEAVLERCEFLPGRDAAGVPVAHQVFLPMASPRR